MADLNVVLAYVFGILLICLIGRMFLWPLKLILKLLYNGLIGGIVLWAVNFVGAFFSFSIGINIITALIAGFLGVPGVLLLIVFKVFLG